MSIKLYVGNLPYEMTEEQLRELFTEAGQVASAKIITDRQTGRPGGSALWRWKPRRTAKRPFPC